MHLLLLIALNCFSLLPCRWDSLLLLLFFIACVLLHLDVWFLISSRSLLQLLLWSLILLPPRCVLEALLIGHLSSFRQINVLLLYLFVLAGQVVAVNEILDVSEAALVLLLGLLDPARLEGRLVERLILSANAAPRLTELPSASALSLLSQLSS